MESLVVAVSAQVPVLLWGSPGTGKTSAILTLGKALDQQVEVVIGSIREPSDFAGLPVVSDGGVTFAPPEWARRLHAAGTGLLFLDELTTAPPAVQAAMLRVILERVVGDLALPSGVGVVAAANPPEQAADGWELAPSLANRFVHLDWTVDAADVAHGLTLGFPTPTVPAPADRGGAEAAARAGVGAFLRARPQLVLQVPETAAGGGRGWPSPRSWEAVVRLLACADAQGASDDARIALVTGAVGEGAGTEFLAWLENADLPDPANVLAAPASFEPPRRSDQTYAVVTGVAALAAARGDQESWDAAWQVLARVARTAPDVAVLAAGTLAKNRPPGARIPGSVSELVPVLRAAGLLR